MKTKAKQRPVELVFRAMADRTRLRILNLLRSGEVCVCDLVAVLNVPQPKVSRHLAYLRRAGLVQARKEGHWAYYRLASNPSPLRSKLLDCLAACDEDLPQFSRDAEKLKLCGKTGCCD
ncbi:MAG TPA: metalloregulator ArsR/SmtB family transcription factor [Pirellulales bacterium]|nr:metalloregulator ArsR/SmtB family transcription factor [Pirellulales bacterium]